MKEINEGITNFNKILRLIQKNRDQIEDYEALKKKLNRVKYEINTLVGRRHAGVSPKNIEAAKKYSERL